ncbi:MAG: hypothetical protein WDO73_12430 [Ignavibacteriota bacterium]
MKLLGRREQIRQEMAKLTHKFRRRPFFLIRVHLCLSVANKASLVFASKISAEINLGAALERHLQGELNLPRRVRVANGAERGVTGLGIGIPKLV